MEGSMGREHRGDLHVVEAERPLLERRRVTQMGLWELGGREGKGS